MSEFLRQWVLALAGAAILCSVAVALTPEGRWRRITALVCGVVMVIALISPIKSFDVGEYGSELSKYQAAAAEAAGKSEEITGRLSRSIIEDESEAYILDKAANMGAEVKADVTARWDTGGWWYPYEAAIKGDCAEGQKKQLAGVIESDLGIPAARQHWSGTDE